MLKIKVKHSGLIIRDGYAQDKFLVTLTSKHGVDYIDYYMGIGHRVQMLGGNASFHELTKSSKRFKVNESYLGAIEKCSLPGKPKDDDIIYAIINDISCCEGLDKFNFMEEFGYEDFRKGEMTYNAIIEEKYKIKDLLKENFNKWYESESKRLEDY